MNQDYFELFGLPRGFEVNREELDAAWRAASARVHPDRFATALPSEKRLAVQWSGIINQAYDTLKQPLRRAAYLCQLNGIEVDAENNTQMSPEFLMTQMELREQLDDAQGDQQALQKLLAQVCELDDSYQNKLADTLGGEADWDQAAAQVREWMFVDKLKKQLKTQID